MLREKIKEKESYKIKTKTASENGGGLIFINIWLKKKRIRPPIRSILSLSEEIAEGIYSNLAMIAHSNSEFVIDFIRLMPGVPKARVKSRVIITPEHAKRLLAALKDNISKYEATFGPIKQTNEAHSFL